MIAHFSPFAPGACGLYEAARDFVRADRLAGRDAELCVVPYNGAPLRVGENDDRSGERVTARSWEECKDADLFVVHGTYVDAWLAKTDAPVVVALHGRPQACFVPEQKDPDRNAFSLMLDFARYQRVKVLLTMWREHMPYWSQFMPEEKLVTSEDPPIDCEMFQPHGVKLDIPSDKRGRRNLLICDSWREDVDCFEAAIGAIHAACRVPGLKVHFFGVDHKDGKPPHCWEHIFSALRNLDALGLVSGRILEIASVYRAMDVVLSPHRIGVRTIGEALASGVPVVAEAGCRYTPYTAQMQDPESVAEMVERCIGDLDSDGAGTRAKARMQAVAHFGLKQFGEKLTGIYEKALRLPLTCETVGEIKESA